MPIPAHSQSANIRADVRSGADAMGASAHCAEGSCDIQGADPKFGSQDPGEILATGRRGADPILSVGFCRVLDNLEALTPC